MTLDTSHCLLGFKTGAHAPVPLFSKYKKFLAGVALALVAGGLLAADPPGFGGAPTIQTPVEPEISSMLPADFLQLLVARNLEVRFSQINAKIAQHLGEAEAGLYEPTFFVSLRKEGREKQRSIDEIRLTNPGASNLEETVHAGELGVRSKLPTGAELSASYKGSGKRNNLIPQNSFGFYDTEYSGLLSLVLKQPLLRNAGRSVTETDRNIAEIEHQVALHQLTQQVLKTSIDGLSLYWQLHRAQETAKLRREALATGQALLTDGQSRVASGRAPLSTLSELRGVVLNREAELARSLQALRDSQSKVATALNVLTGTSKVPSTAPKLHAAAPVQTLPVLDDVLATWSPYQIGLLRQQQSQLRLNFASSQMKPGLDLVMSYGATGLAYTQAEAEKWISGGKYPDWYVGLNLELPVKGNQKASQQFLAQSARVEQAEVELSAIRNAFANDLVVRLADLKNAQTVLDLSDSELKLRQSIFDNEKQRVQLGSGSTGNLIQRQTDLIESQQRLLENQIRYEIALATWQYTQGSLLREHGIQITSAIPLIR